jgi:hypothetical protein
MPRATPNALTVRLYPGTWRSRSIRITAPGDRAGAAIFVVCGRRHGLIASLTRMVSFDDVPSAARPHAVSRVDAAFIAATVPGRTVASAFQAGVDAYTEHGLGPLEWLNHHQGGPTGYEPRDYEANSSSEAVIEVNQAFAWNPSAPGMKSEDTILSRDTGAEILTVDPRWPVAVIEGIPRPLVLRR